MNLILSYLLIAPNVAGFDSDVEKIRPARPDTKAIQAPEGEGCPRCGGCVYAAEQMLARGTVYFQSMKSSTIIYDFDRSIIQRVD